MFTKAAFILSAAKPNQFPELLTLQGKKYPEIAVVGRSNVGKSSLLNHLTQNKRLAHVSSKPGKTQLINFFNIDNRYALVDLPGYGFANVPKSLRLEWGDLVQAYLETRPSLALILLLSDLRHPPSKEDIAFAKWANHFKKPLVVVFTKSDKINKSGIITACKKNYSLLSEGLENKPLTYIPYSIKEGKGRTILINEIQRICDELDQ